MANHLLAAFTHRLSAPNRLALALCGPRANDPYLFINSFFGRRAKITRRDRTTKLYYMTYDLLGIGLGPFNLGLAALCYDIPQLSTAFIEQKDSFDWHPGLLL